MPFKLDSNPVFWAPVKVRTPSEAGFTDENFRAKFKALTITEFNTYDLADPEGARSFLEDTLVDVGDVEAADGAPLAFTHSVREKLIDAPHVRSALVLAYMRAIDEAARGN